MQMSIERFQEVHKLIWNTVISHASEVARRKATVWFLKGVGIDKAYQKGLLDLDEVELIESNNRCLLCATCSSCMDCILGTCKGIDSLYSKAANGDEGAMEEIRDVVDKQLFTDLSIVDLH